MKKETVLVGVANLGEKYLDLDEVKAWVPKDINYFNDIVFFKNDKTYYTMKRETFKKLFTTV